VPFTEPTERLSEHSLYASHFPHTNALHTKRGARRTLGLLWLHLALFLATARQQRRSREPAQPEARVAGRIDALWVTNWRSRGIRSSSPIWCRLLA
jgi:hypothetical protein